MKRLFSTRAAVAAIACVSALAAAACAATAPHNELSGARMAGEAVSGPAVAFAQEGVSGAGVTRSARVL